MYLTTDELNARFRSDVNDPLEGVDSTEPDSENLWKNAEVFAYMEEAADVVARATLGLYKMFSLPVTAGTAVVPLSRSVLDIRRAALVTARRVLESLPQSAIDRGYAYRDYGEQFGNTLLQDTGTPQYYIRDRERKALVLAPIPVSDDTLELQCSVTLSTPLLCGMPLPFLELPDQRLMLLWMKHLAYAKHDADTLDLARSDAFRAQFYAESVEREVDIRRQRRTPAPITMEW